MRSLSAALLLLPAAITAVNLDCKHIRVDKQDFNFEALGGPKQVHDQVRHPLFISNTTYTLDICKKLERDKDIPTKYQCPPGTQVCAITREYRPEEKEGFPQAVTPIAGEFAASDGRHLEPKFTRLKDSESNDDAKKEGLRIELNGGMSEDKKKQKAIIEMICDAEMEGTEGFDKAEEKMMEFDTYAALQKREDGDEDKKDPEDEEPLPDLDKGKALKFVSYKTEKDDVGVLRLEWKTKYACEGAEAPKTPSAKGSWGFFTWFLIIVFLLIAAYIIFGSWLNYNRYGARGWDLIPHGDTIRDIPYIVKDWSSGVAGRMSSNGNRGGYSAV